MGTCCSLTRLKFLHMERLQYPSIKKSTGVSQTSTDVCPLLQNSKIPIWAPWKGAVGTRVKPTAIQFLIVLDTQTDCEWIAR